MTLERNVTMVTVRQPVSGEVRKRAWWPERQRPLTTSQVHPAALAAALRLAAGDRSRLVFLPDGSVLVANSRRTR